MKFLKYDRCMMYKITSGHLFQIKTFQFILTVLNRGFEEGVQLRDERYVKKVLGFVKFRRTGIKQRPPGS